MEITWIIFAALSIWMLSGWAKGNLPGASMPKIKKEGDDLGEKIGAIFRTLAKELKNSGEMENCKMCLYIADKADGRGWRGRDIRREEREGAGLTIYQAALVLSSLSYRTSNREPFYNAARSLDEIAEKL